RSAVVKRRNVPAKVVARVPSKGRNAQPKVLPVQKLRSKEYANAIHAYESGLKQMHHEEYERAIKAFRELIAEHSEEPEIQERARVLIQACEKKLLEKAKAVLKSA